ncbi:universal stress protein [candidate division WOR-3 bacterium]|nr:universal stress protein [candidate division WOR-3 bacterium]
MKILLVILPPWLSPASSDFVIKITRCLNAGATVLGVIDMSRIARTASNEGSSKEAAQENYVQEAYENLYSTEERFKKESVEVSIKIKEVTIPEELLTEIKRNNADIVCLAGSFDTLWLEIIRGSLTAPILLVPQER